MEMSNETAAIHERSSKKIPWGYVAALVLFLLLAANVLVLDYEVLFSNRTKETQLSVVPQGQPRLEGDSGIPEALVERNPQVSGETAVAINDCPQSCLDAISQSTSQSSQGPDLKEIYIPLGSGSTYSQTWEEIDGLEAVVDLANYPPIKLIMFEASLRIPTANGRVYAKLYDVIEKHDAWNSSVWAEGSSSYRAESANVTFSPGRKLYRVKMKSTMGYEAILDSARIKILLK